MTETYLDMLPIIYSTWGLLALDLLGAAGCLLLLVLCSVFD